MSKPRVLVLGGLGFIGQRFVKFLVDSNVASKVRVVDKRVVEMARLPKELEEVYAKVDFVQANLINPVAAASVFNDPSGPYDYVINLAAETRYGLNDTVYNEGIVQLSVNCAKEAAKNGVKRYIEVSTAQVYEASSTPSRETDTLSPWTGVARAKAKAEEEIKKIPGLKYVIVRPAIVYGPGDIKGLAPRIVCGLVYKKLGQPMQFMWDGDLRMNTVHVNDVSRALWHLTSHGNDGATYNLVDKNDTTQAKFNVILERIFGISTSFAGNLLSKLGAKLGNLTEEINSTHIKPWADLCTEGKINYTPLTPYLEEELLLNNALSVNGSAIEATGFSYNVPTVEEDKIREQIKQYQDWNWFPGF